jgi:hypothetical protein
LESHSDNPSIGSFNNMMVRLNRARQVDNSEPESAWRATFDLLANAAEQHEAIVKSLASVAVLLGLAGTVLGFARLAEPLLNIRQGAAPISITNELAGAFIATLAGILGAALILLAAIPILRVAQDHWLEAVEGVGRLVIIPSLPRPPTKIQDIILEELKRRLDTVGQAWTAALVQPAEQLTAVARASRSSVEMLTQALNAIPPETLKDLASSARSIRTAATSIAKSSVNYESSAGEVAKVASAFEGALRDFTSGVATNTNKIEAMRQTLTDANAEVRSHGQAVVTSVSSMTTSFKDLTTIVGDRMVQESRILDSAERATGNIDAHLQELNKAMQELYSGARELMLSSSAIKDAITPLPRHIATGLAKWLEAFQREEALVFGQFRARLESLAGVSANLSKAAEALASMNLTSVIPSEHLHLSKAAERQSIGSSFSTEQVQPAAIEQDSKNIDHATWHSVEELRHDAERSEEMRASVPSAPMTIASESSEVASAASSFSPSDLLEEPGSWIHQPPQQPATEETESKDNESVLSHDSNRTSSNSEAGSSTSVTTPMNGPITVDFESSHSSRQPLPEDQKHVPIRTKASWSWLSGWFKRSAK